MTEKSWPWSTVAALGDGAAELNEALSREFLATYFLVQNPALEGVSKGVLGELAVTGAASPLAVAAGSAVCYGLYINDAVVNPTVSTPAVGTTGGRVVLQTNWGGTGGAGLEARTRIAVKKSADGVAAIPALTQVFGTTWEVSLATFTITTGGAITVTDARVFRRATGVVGAAEIEDLIVGTAEIADLSVTSGKLAALAVVAGKIADGAVDTAARIANGIITTAKIAALQITTALINDLAVTAGKIAVDAVTTVKILDLNVTTGKLADLAVTAVKIAANVVAFAKMVQSAAGLSVVGRAANTAGDFAEIVAANDGEVLRRSGTAVGFGKIVEANVTAGALTPASLTNRTRKFMAPVLGGVNNGTGAALIVAQGSKGIAMPDAVSSFVMAGFQVPTDFVSDMLVRPIVTCATAGNLRSNFVMEGGPLGNDNLPLGIGNTTVALLAGVLTAVQAVNVGAVLGDFMCVGLNRLGSDALDTLSDVVYLLGFEVEYTADS